jgi:hypothetical protein
MGVGSRWKCSLDKVRSTGVDLPPRQAPVRTSGQAPVRTSGQAERRQATPKVSNS